ncbi:MAG: hypothetical protein EOP45_16640 [Sphingobacteriaceae bacterium]|nr:MAG: hypothetical protein EOP45_16640 [Sphingobacteriaceae bacterium]
MTNSKKKFNNPEDFLKTNENEELDTGDLIKFVIKNPIESIKMGMDMLSGNSTEPETKTEDIDVNMGSGKGGKEMIKNQISKSLSPGMANQYAKLMDRTNNKSSNIDRIDNDFSNVSLEKLGNLSPSPTPNNNGIKVQAMDNNGVRVRNESRRT